ncbi:MAG: FecR domain-containing protein [Syntrophales bacterium]|nr:FecR domain-containing protein [Syntrophales bacterium]
MTRRAQPLSQKKHRRPNYLIVISWVAVLWLLCGLTTVMAADRVGSVTHLSGPLLAKKADGTIKTLGLNSIVELGDTLVTEKKTYARIKFVDNSEVVLRPKSQFKIDQFFFDQAKPKNDKAVFNLVKGGVRAVTGQIGKRFQGDNYRMNTPLAVAGVRGTLFELRICEGNCPGINDGLYLFVLEGSITVTNGAGTQDVSAGQFAYVRDTQTMPVILPSNPGLSFTLPESIQLEGKLQDGCIVR